MTFTLKAERKGGEKCGFIDPKFFEQLNVSCSFLLIKGEIFLISNFCHVCECCSLSFG